MVLRWVFEIKEAESTGNVYLIKDGNLRHFLTEALSNAGGQSG